MAELFRKEALESFSSNSGMSKGIRAISIKNTVFVVLLTVCAAAFTLWLAFGTVYETVSVDGIIWPAENNGAVYAQSDGTVTKTVVSVGSMVSAGDILAIIPSQDILSGIESGKASGISESDLQKLYGDYDNISVIRANINGIVTEIVKENAYIRTGEKIASVVPYDTDGNNKTLTAFIPAQKGGLITVGMEAQVMPDFAPREEYGYIKAYISSISQYPITGQRIQDTNSELFLSTLDERESYLLVEITFIPEAQAQSRLKWSNPKSGAIKVAMGTICQADIVVKKCRPYEWLF